MTIFRDDAKTRPDKMSGWMKEFADYWKHAEARIKGADYVSNVQRALNGQRSVDDVVSDLRNRVGLDLIDELKKESDSSDTSKKASMEEGQMQEMPSAIKNNSELLERVTAYIDAHPFTSFEALAQMEEFNDPMLDDPEVEEYVRGIISNAREGKEEREDRTNFVVDHIDASDNKYLDYNEDRTNKI